MALSPVSKEKIHIKNMPLFGILANWVFQKRPRNENTPTSSLTIRDISGLARSMCGAQPLFFQLWTRNAIHNPIKADFYSITNAEFSKTL